MTAREALDKRIRRIRLPFWEPTAYAEFFLVGDKMHGPWVTIRDVTGESNMLVWEFLKDTCDEWEAA